jgi:protein-tyrosine phosphatase
MLNFKNLKYDSSSSLQEWRTFLFGLENQYTREMTAFKRRLLWDGCSNTRHLGGFVTEDQHVTNDALVRSDNLIKLTSTGQTALVADGVTTVIDLRFFGELEKNPNPFAGSISTPVYLHRPMMSEHDQEAMAPIRAAQTTLEAYMATLEGFKGNIAAIMTAIADSAPGRVVIHCSAGKDRTGLTTALALRCAGVSLQSIAEDYALTDQYFQADYDKELAQIQNPKERADDLQTKPEFILDTLNELELRYGSVQGYLRAAGMSAEMLEWLKFRLIETGSSVVEFKVRS